MNCIISLVTSIVLGTQQQSCVCPFVCPTFF